MHQLAAVMVFLLTLARAELPIFSTVTVDPCDNFNISGSEVDLDELAGKWYAVEIVQHDSTENETTVIEMLGVCPELHISSKTQQPDVRIVWEEKAGSLNYRFVTHYNPAVWVSDGAQTGTLTEQAYRQFEGRVLVQNSSATQLLLSFCYVADDADDFSLVLSRDRYADLLDQENANKLLKERGFRVKHIRRTCQKSLSMGNRTTASVMILFLTVLFHIK